MRLMRPARRIPFDTKQNLGTRQNALQGCFDSGFKASVAPAVVVETHDSLQVGIANRLTISTASQRRDDLLCTGPFRGFSHRPAYKNPAAARRVSGTSRTEG